MKIYTKGGDKGITSLKGGMRVPKDHSRIEAYGTLDELIAWIGLLRDQDLENETKKLLLTVQDKLMISASLLAAEKEMDAEKLPQISEEDIRQLEKAIDAIDSKLPRITSFIIPGGHTVVSYCHIARSVCRRAERMTVKMIKQSEKLALTLKYLNRLSDYLFILSRKLLKDFGAKEIFWKPES